MFKDRYDAAYQLVTHLTKYSDDPSAIVLAIPRGGLELGYVLARELHLPLDISLTKKIGHPGNPEYGIGAVSQQNIIISRDFEHIPELQGYLEQQVSHIRQLLHERNKLYRDNKPPLDLYDKIVIVVDDGVATGNTLLATLALIRKSKPRKIVVAIPVAPASTLDRLRIEADEVICLKIPEMFFGVAQVYEKFDQVDDKEAVRLLHEANR